MSERFLQFHLLTSYPPANLNRDDLGRPKTAVMGGSTRLRISSQSLKRAWRTSELFQEAFENRIGLRTRKMVTLACESLKKQGVEGDVIEQIKGALLSKVGTVDQVLHYSREEEHILYQEAEKLAQAVTEFAGNLDSKGKTRTKEIEKFVKEQSKEVNIFINNHKNIDIALFGRMLTASPRNNMEAACQVAHAITVHKVALEDDYFTAVDDLNSPDEEIGSAHIGITEFAAGLFYLYVCIDRQLLLSNLDGDEDLCNQTLATLVEAMATIAPTGKQNSFASRARASYILAEKGSQQPRSLSVAYLKPVNNRQDMLGKAIEELETTRANMDRVYEKCAEQSYLLNAAEGKGSLKELQDFVRA